MSNIENTEHADTFETSEPASLPVVPSQPKSVESKPEKAGRPTTVSEAIAQGFEKLTSGHKPWAIPKTLSGRAVHMQVYYALFDEGGYTPSRKTALYPAYAPATARSVMGETFGIAAGVKGVAMWHPTRHVGLVVEPKGTLPTVERKSATSDLKAKATGNRASHKAASNAKASK